MTAGSASAVCSVDVAFAPDATRPETLVARPMACVSSSPAPVAIAAVSSNDRPSAPAAAAAAQRARMATNASPASSIPTACSAALASFQHREDTMKNRLARFLLTLISITGCSEPAVPADDAGTTSLPDFALPWDFGPGRDASGLIADPCESGDQCRFGLCGSRTLDSPLSCWGFAGCDQGRNLGCPAEAVCVPGCDTCLAGSEFIGACARACDAGSCPPGYACSVDARGYYPMRRFCKLPECNHVENTGCGPDQVCVPPVCGGEDCAPDPRVPGTCLQSCATGVACPVGYDCRASTLHPDRMYCGRIGAPAM